MDRALEAQYAKHVVGRRVAVAPQTLAEALYGATMASWGPPRRRELARAIARARMLPVDRELIDRVANLRNQCRLNGHALHQARHNADLWIAAAAIRWSLPLVAHDGLFLGCPGLDLRTELVS